MERDEEDIIRVTLESLDAAFAEVIPDLDGFVIAGSHEVGSICTWVQVDILVAFVVNVRGKKSDDLATTF